MEAKEEANYKSVQPQKYATTYNDVSNDKEILLQKIENQRQKELIVKYEQEISIFKADNTKLKTEINKLLD
jgi:hypothetical protein